jgi:tRNA pseudouridine38-40 synthase
MRNIKLTVAYDGTGYKGWQFQKNGRTVQEELEKAIKKVFGKVHRVIAASRTDAGVHARQQTVNFKIPEDISIPVGKIPEALNAYLPGGIAVTEAKKVPAEFHSRFDAKNKLYRYYIVNSRKRDPFTEKYAWRIPYPIDVPLMKKEARELVGRHDFKSFQAKDKRERSSVRRISKLRLTRKGSSLIIDIEADGFLYNMVRNIVGTLVDIGRGYLPEGSMRKILREKDRTKAGPTAPAKGLFLTEVRY